MGKEHTGRVLSLNNKPRPHLDEIQIVPLAGQEYYLRVSHHCFKGQLFGQDFLQIGSVLDQDASATLPTVAAFHSSFGKNIINCNCFLNWYRDHVFLGRYCSHRPATSTQDCKKKSPTLDWPEEKTLVLPCQQLSALEVRSPSTERTQNVIQ